MTAQLPFPGIPGPDDDQPTESTERGEWLRVVIAALARRAAKPGTFTTYEVARDEQLPEPPHHTLWGTAVHLARVEGLITSVAATPSLRPRTNSSLVRVWRGSRYVQDNVA